LLSPTDGLSGLFWPADFYLSHQAIAYVGIGPVFARRLRPSAVFARRPGDGGFFCCLRPQPDGRVCFRPQAFLPFDQRVAGFRPDAASPRSLAPTSVSARTPASSRTTAQPWTGNRHESGGFRASFAAVSGRDLGHAPFAPVHRQRTWRAPRIAPGGGRGADCDGLCTARVSAVNQRTA